MRVIIETLGFYAIYILFYIIFRKTSERDTNALRAVKRKITIFRHLWFSFFFYVLISIFKKAKQNINKRGRFKLTIFILFSRAYYRACIKI